MARCRECTHRPGSDRIAQLGRIRFAFRVHAAFGDRQPGEKRRISIGSTPRSISFGHRMTLAPGNALLEQRQRAGRVCDIADVDALPARPQQDGGRLARARPARSRGCAASQRFRAGEGVDHFQPERTARRRTPRVKSRPDGAARAARAPFQFLFTTRSAFAW